MEQPSPIGSECESWGPPQFPLSELDQLAVERSEATKRDVVISDRPGVCADPRTAARGFARADDALLIRRASDQALSGRARLASPVRYPDCP
jgi:hypothetical protein